MRLLRRELAGGVVVLRDTNPITAEAGAGDWMSFDQLPCRRPDFFAAGLLTTNPALLAESNSSQFEIVNHCLAANPTDTVGEQDNDKDNEERSESKTANEILNPVSDRSGVALREMPEWIEKQAQKQQLA